MGNDQNALSKSMQKPDHEAPIRGTDTLEHYRQKLARIALDEMHQFVAILDAEGTLLEASRAALVCAGLKLSDVEGKPFWECYWWAVSQEIQDTLKDAVMRAAKGEFIRYDVEIYGRAAGKETIIIDFSIMPVKDEMGKVIYLVPEGRDITEKKAYEREIAHKNADLLTLRERIQELDISKNDLLIWAHNAIERKKAEERLQALAEIVSSSDDAILSKDLDGIITSWNPAAERIYGYSAQEIVGQPVTRIFPPNHQNEFQQIMARIRRGERVDHYETTRVRKDGTFLTVSVTVSPLKESSGTIIGASAIARDISERIALEQQREAFVSLVTHELKTPLTALQGNVQLAQRRLRRLLTQAGSLTDEQQQTLEEVLLMLGRSQQPLRVQQRLINDLLDLSHIQQDQVELRFAVFDLIKLVCEITQDHQAAYPSRLILLELPEQDSISVYADQDRITQVLGNYLTNALKFAPESLPVQVSINVEAASVRVAVTDQGPGLSSEQQVHIWKRFYQIPQTPLQIGWKVGLGLGLYLCQQLIHRQQGEVGVESSPGQGATFWFTLPYQGENAVNFR